jgi:CHAD domain-containing protein
VRDDDDLWRAGTAQLTQRVAKARSELRRAAKGDADGIHDLRVAIRKIRATLSVLSGPVIQASARRRSRRRRPDLEGG